MQLYSRGGKYYAEGYYVDEAGRRARWRRSTGVRDDGSRKAAQLAEQAGYQIAQSLAAGLNRTARVTTLEHALDALIEQMELADRAQPTIDIVAQKSVHLFRYFGRKCMAEAITATQLEQYARARLGTVPPTKPGTVHRELRTLAQALRAVNIEPPALPDIGRVYRPRELWLDTDQQRRLVQACHPSYRDHVILYLQLGVRASELYRLDAPDLDRMTIRVRGTKTEGADRTLPLTADAAAVLRRRGLPLPEWANSDRALKAACVRAGVPRASLNVLRHSYATTLARAGVPALDLAHLLGHTSTRMVERVYTHLNGSAAHQTFAAKLPRICAVCVPATVPNLEALDGTRDDR